MLLLLLRVLLLATLSSLLLLAEVGEGFVEGSAASSGCSLAASFFARNRWIADSGDSSLVKVVALLRGGGVTEGLLFEVEERDKTTSAVE